MSTSGSYNFFIRRNELVKASMRGIRALRAGRDPTADQITDFSQSLNLMLKQWQGKPDFARGLKLFSRKRLHLFLAKGQQRYTIGPATGDARCTELFGRTTISANEAAAQTVLSITSNADATSFPGQTQTMAASDFIGIELDDGTLHWSTISGTPAATATIANALPSQASAGNFVYWFTTRAQMPIEIEHALLRDSDYKDRDLIVYREVAQYERIPDKFADGDPNCLLFEPQLINSVVTFDYQPDDVTKFVRMTAIYPAEDMDSINDEFGFPQVWHNAIKWGLAKEIAPELAQGLWLPEHQSNYEMALLIAQNANPETTDVHFEPGRE